MEQQHNQEMLIRAKNARAIGRAVATDYFRPGIKFRPAITSLRTKRWRRSIRETLRHEFNRQHFAVVVVWIA